MTSNFSALTKKTLTWRGYSEERISAIEKRTSCIAAFENIFGTDIPLSVKKPPKNPFLDMLDLDNYLLEFAVSVKSLAIADAFREHGSYIKFLSNGYTLVKLARAVELPEDIQELGSKAKKAHENYIARQQALSKIKERFEKKSKAEEGTFLQKLSQLTEPTMTSPVETGACTPSKKTSAFAKSQ